MTVRDSSAPPSWASTVRVDRPKPAPDNRRATSPGVERPLLRTNRRAPSTTAAKTVAESRFTRLTTSTSADAHPIRALANATDDGCEITRTLSAPSSRTNVTPRPWNIGSPLARTHTLRSAFSANIDGNAGIIGDGQVSLVGARRAPRCVAGTKSSWRGDPIRTSAPRIAPFALSDSPSQPSAPMPTITTGCAVIAASGARSSEAEAA